MTCKLGVLTRTMQRGSTTGVITDFFFHSGKQQLKEQKESELSEHLPSLKCC